MISKVISEVILAPFRLFEYFIQAMVFPPKPVATKTPEIRDLLTKVKALERANRNLADLNAFLRYRLDEQPRAHQRDFDMQDKRWREIVKGLQRQLNQERLNK